MEYTTTYINRNYLIKVYGFDNEGKRINKLLGVSGLIALIGVELANKFIARAEKAAADPNHNGEEEYNYFMAVCKLRRGLKVSLYMH